MAGSSRGLGLSGGGHLFGSFLSRGSFGRLLLGDAKLFETNRRSGHPALALTDLSVLDLRLALAPALGGSLAHLLAEQPHRANGVVVGWDGVIHLIGITVSVGQGDNGDLQSARLQYGGVLLLRVYHEDGAWQATHVLDTAQQALQTLQLILQVLRLFLGQALEVATLSARLELAHVLDAFLDGLEVGKHAT